MTQGAFSCIPADGANIGGWEIFFLVFLEKSSFHQFLNMIEVALYRGNSFTITIVVTEIGCMYLE